MAKEALVETEEPKPVFTKLVKKLAESDFEMTEAVQAFVTVTPPADTTREEMLDPVFWTHVAKRLTPLTEIRAMPKDGAWYAQYLVTYADHLQVRLFELNYWKIETTKPAEPDLYSITWKSPVLKWCVIRKKDDQRIKTDFADKEDAIKWAQQNVQALRG